MKKLTFFVLVLSFFFISCPGPKDVYDLHDELSDITFSFAVNDIQIYPEKENIFINKGDKIDLCVEGKIDSNIYEKSKIVLSIMCITDTDVLYDFDDCIITSGYEKEQANYIFPINSKEYENLDKTIELDLNNSGNYVLVIGVYADSKNKKNYDACLVYEYDIQIR